MDKDITTYDSRSASREAENGSGYLSLSASIRCILRGARFYIRKAIISHKTTASTATGNRTPVIQPWYFPLFGIERRSQPTTSW